MPKELKTFTENDEGEKNPTIFKTVESFLIKMLGSETSLTDTEAEIKDSIQQFYDNHACGDDAIDIATRGIYNMIIKIHPPFKDQKILLISNKSIIAAAKLWLENESQKSQVKLEKIKTIAINNNKILDNIFNDDLAEDCRNMEPGKQKQFLINNGIKIKTALSNLNYKIVAKYLEIDSNTFKTYLKELFPKLYDAHFNNYTKFTDELAVEIINYLEAGKTIANIIKFYNAKNIKISENSFWKEIGKRSPIHTKAWYSKKKQDVKNEKIEKVKHILTPNTINVFRAYNPVNRNINTLLETHQEELKKALMASSVIIVAEVLNQVPQNLTASIKKVCPDWWANVYSKKEDTEAISFE